jgi:hypothetical protein
MSFTAMLNELKLQIEKNKDAMENISRSNPNKAFVQINQIASSVSAKYGVILQLHFPDSRKITDTNSYGTENLSIVVDPQMKRFPIPRDSIKERAREFLGEVETKDAYMYEGKEGAKVFLQNGRIDILPGSIHMWCQIDNSIRKFVDWLLIYCYGVKPI